MRDVNDIHHTENQRKAAGQQEQKCAEGYAVETLNDPVFHPDPQNGVFVSCGGEATRPITGLGFAAIVANAKDSVTLFNEYPSSTKPAPTLWSFSIGTSSCSCPKPKPIRLPDLAR
jgi:hypothetical protein